MKEDQQKITVFELCRLHTIPFVELQGIDLWNPNSDPGCSLEPMRTLCESDVLWVPNARTSQVWGGWVGRGCDPGSSWRTHTRAPQCLLHQLPQVLSPLGLWHHWEGLSVRTGVQGFLQKQTLRWGLRAGGLPDRYRIASGECCRKEKPANLRYHSRSGTRVGPSELNPLGREDSGKWHKAQTLELLQLWIQGAMLSILHALPRGTLVPRHFCSAGTTHWVAAAQRQPSNKIQKLAVGLSWVLPPCCWLP